MKVNTNDAPNQKDRLLDPLTTVGESTVDLNDLTRAVSRSLGRNNLAVQEWSVHPLHYTVRNTISAGLYRLQGVASAEAHEKAGADPALSDSGLARPLSRRQTSSRKI